ncbi:iron-containing alcohol dehydrogenase family protein [Clostridium gasigenes]|uniref:Iron-containing alcohol dehydrogenase n=1 Tax=Clostridium gasigenes TaxID=94869 RepID=A0A7X0VR00_9CLOT|nr:iron-containing alcohol dehydrogenase family protein [Clostridium gasigenes]MBB6714453.1 iron-containing alcohol dehydrogenase [Clostridium gasigenes]
MNFKYFMPTRILVGKNIIVNNYNEFKSFGKKAYIITGRNSSKINGSLDDVVKALEFANIEYVIFSEVEENPSLETIEKAAEIGKREKVDFIIGIGGGSPIDASKVIAIMIKNKELTKDTILQSGKLCALDVIAVPTTSGTGTETTQYAIVTDNKNKTKVNFGQEVFPKIAFLDETYTQHMNLKTTLNTAIDSLSHIIEGYLNVNANIITDALAEKSIKLWSECIEELISGEISCEIRRKLMIASTMAGIIIAQTGTSLPHGMGYPLTYFKNIPHGLANGCLYIEYLKVFKNRERVENIYKLLGLKSHSELENLLSKFTKVDIEISEEEIKTYTDAMWENKAKLKNHPENISYEELYNIYYRSLK